MRVPEIRSTALRGVLWEKVRNVMIDSNCTVKVGRLKFDIKVNEPMRMRYQLTTDIGNLTLRAWDSYNNLFFTVGNYEDLCHTSH